MSIARKKFDEFVNSLTPEQIDKFKSLADSQKPEVMLIACSDSRILAHEILGSHPGEVFILRNAGNNIPPYDSRSPSNEALSVQFAVDVLNVKEIVVCGHANCGAMSGILDLEGTRGFECVHDRLAECAEQFPEGYVDELRKDANKKQALKQLTRENVRLQIENLKLFLLIYLTNILLASSFLNIR